jgi:hypothetical protein
MVFKAKENSAHIKQNSANLYYLLNLTKKLKLFSAKLKHHSRTRQYIMTFLFWGVKYSLFGGLFMAKDIIPIQNLIYEIRGHKVMLDRDLAELYGVETKKLNQGVKRNIGRFPPDFMFQLTEKEWTNLRSQIVTSSWGGLRYLPYAFTEQGIAMLSGILNSDIAINVNIQIMRAFVKLRHYTLTQTGSNEQIAELRKLLMLHIENCDNKFSEQDETIKKIILALNNLIEHPKPTKKIGFTAN